LAIQVVEVAHNMSKALKNINVHTNCMGSKGLKADCIFPTIFFFDCRVPFLVSKSASLHKYTNQS
jgi:hypothetical protein